MSYEVRGNQLFHNGHQTQLYGVNVIGCETQDAVIGGLWTNLTIAEWVGQIRDMGFNALRIPVGTRCLQNVEVNPGIVGIWQGSKNENLLKGKRSLELFDMLIAELEKQHMRYIFDLHHLENGKIPDLWWTPSYPESQWIADMVFLAKRYKGNAGFCAIDSKNEPSSDSTTWGDGNPQTDWKAASERAFKAIYAVNPDIIHIVEWTGTKTGMKELTDNPLDIPLKKLALSCHLYGPDVWSNQQTGEMFGEGFKEPNFPSNMKNIWDKQWGNVARKQLVILGEFGGYAGLKNPLDKDWQIALMDYCRSNLFLNFFHWGLGDNSGSECGGLYSNGGWKDVRQDKLDIMETAVSSFATYTDETATPPVTAPIPSKPEIDDNITIEKPTGQTGLKPITKTLQTGDTVYFTIGGYYVELTIVAAQEGDSIECAYLKDGEIFFCVLPVKALKQA